MFLRTVLFFGVWVFTGNIVVTAQQLNLSYYTVNDGLLSNAVLKIYQDSQGFIWISTVDGLSKYNGHKFINYTAANGLPHPLVNDFLETNDGKLVIACNDGSLAWIENGGISKVVNAGIVINRFVKTSTGKILVVTDRQGIQEFQNGSFYKPPQPFPFSNYFSVAEINDSLLLIGSDSSVQFLTKDYRLIKRFGQPTSIGENKVLKDSKGRLWTSHMTGLTLLTPDSILGLPVPLRQFSMSLGANISRIFEDNESTIWFAGHYGLVQLDSNNSARVYGKKNGLLSDHITDVFQDREGNLWIGTDMGLCKLPAKIRPTTFDEFLEMEFDYIGFLFAEGSDRFLTKTLRGWKYFNKNKEEWSAPLPVGAMPYVTQSHLNGQPPLLANKRPVLLNSPAGIKLSAFFRQVKPGIIYHAVRDKEGNFFMSDGRRFYIYDGREVYADTIITSVVSGLAIDSTGKLWVATWADGLIQIQYDKIKGRFNFLKKTTFFPGMHIRALMADDSGVVWVGTRYNGLYRLRPKGENEYQSDRWTTAEGLSSNWVYNTIARDERGNIWVVHRSGIDKLVPRGNTSFRVFHFSRVNNLFKNINGVFPDKNGIFWLMTSDGLVRFRDNEMEKQGPWPVFITAVNIGDSVYHPSNRSLSLSHSNNSLRIDFASASFINEKQVMYSYRLLGNGDTAWSEAENLHSVSFASLQPGKYRFEVRTLGWDGRWGQSTTLDFSIRPSFWQSVWFILLLLFLITGTGAWLVRRRINSIRQEAQFRQQIAETEMMALRAQMNPHFLFNSLNAIDNLIQTNQPDKATKYLARFAKLIRLVLDSSKNNVVPLHKEIETLKLYLEMEKFRSSDKFNYRLLCDPELLHGDHEVPPLIAQPFVENAIHHGLLNKQEGERFLDVTISAEKNYIVFTITDNGVGRQEAGRIKTLYRPEHISYGMNISRDRLSLYNKRQEDQFIEIADLYEGDKPAGTRVRLKIKITPG